MDITRNKGTEANIRDSPMMPTIASTARVNTVYAIAMRSAIYLMSSSG